MFGADHGGYIERMNAAVKALSNGRVPLDVKLIQLVKLFKNGEPFKMSKRAGTFVTLRDVVEQAGRDVTRFHMLTRKNDAPLDFDFAKVLEQSKDNPVWYVQYASARVHSVMKRAAEMGVDVSDTALAGADLSALDHPAEMELVRKLAEYPRLIEAAASAHEPHRVAFYLYDLAGALHSLWNRGNDETALRFIQEGDAKATATKIALLRAVGVVISSGLAILGVTRPRKCADKGAGPGSGSNQQPVTPARGILWRYRFRLGPFCGFRASSGSGISLSASGSGRLRRRLRLV